MTNKYNCSIETSNIKELSYEEINKVNGGIFFLLPFASAFVNGLGVGVLVGGVFGTGAAMFFRHFR